MLLSAVVLAGCAPARPQATAPPRDLLPVAAPTTSTTTTLVLDDRPASWAASRSETTPRTTVETATSMPQATVVRDASSCAGWRDLIASYSWPVDTACRVMMCESGGDPDARNPSGAESLFQILNGPSDPAENVALAFDMWRSRGWQPWDSSRRCWS